MVRYLPRMYSCRRSILSPALRSVTLIVGLSLTFDPLTCIGVATCLESSVSIVRTVDASPYVRSMTVPVMNNDTMVVIDPEAEQSGCKE